ncbi:MAG: ABC transporter ATP-binding protein [Eubacteriales bacterium]
MKKNRKAKARSQFATMKRVMRYLRSSGILIAVSLILTLAAVVLTLYVPILIGRAIDLAVGVGNVDIAGMGRILLRVATVVAITAVLQWLINIINNRITYYVVRKIRQEAFEKLQKLPISFIDSHQTGDIVSRIITDTDQFSDGLLMGLTQFFNGIFTILGTLLFMLSISPSITVAVVVITPASLLVAAFIAKKTYSMFKLQSEIRGEQTSLIDESITDHKTVAAFSREQKMQERFDEVNERLSDASLRATFFSSITNPATRFLNSIVYMLVALFGALSVITLGGASITVGQLSSFLAYANQYTKPFNEISGVITELQNALACAARVFELTDSPEQKPDPETPAVIPYPTGNIRFENVCFSYTPERPLIRDFNLTVKPGQRVAIVGPTGCGKTTLINLIMRYYDVDSGRILIDGIDTRSMRRSDLRAMFGMVLQDTWISQGTIRDNIAFGRPQASDEEIINAAKAAHAHSFIRRLPEGYNTVVGESGGNLSHGQRQLLCIARVMLALPDMLILDEATSSIDTRTEMKIQKAFTAMMEGRTSFIVAHRLSTIKEADIILVMKDGNIIEKGTHGELLAAGGFYCELYNSQFPHRNA